jgi:Uncharacterized distant relative of cell wall-associated hydrolases
MTQPDRRNEHKGDTRARSAHIYEAVLHGRVVRTGDLVATRDGAARSLLGRFWQAIGRCLPGVIHHVLMYVGPGLRFVEAGPAGVRAFTMPHDRWDPYAVEHLRGGVTDALFGVANPLAGRALSPMAEAHIRRAAADYCLAQVGKPYNLRFSQPEREDRFYCSQLLWHAYARQGIALLESPTLGASSDGEGRRRILFPADLWRACRTRHHADGIPPAEAAAAEAPCPREALADRAGDRFERAVDGAADLWDLLARRPLLPGWRWELFAPRETPTG